MMKLVIGKGCVSEHYETDKETLSALASGLGRIKADAEIIKIDKNTGGAYAMADIEHQVEDIQNTVKELMNLIMTSKIVR